MAMRGELAETLRHASNQDDGYPRPMLRRASWLSLDGPAGFAIDDEDRGVEQEWWRDGAPFQRSIQLPYPPESAASGIADTSPHPIVWYRMEVSSTSLAASGHTARRQLLLHFGAVDHDATVWVDGTRVGSHEGGQTAFSLDISSALVPSRGVHTVVVRAHDDPYDRSQPRGKQTWQDKPRSIWYERCTGIWRPVWLESVPALHVERLGWRSSVRRATVQAEIELSRAPDQPIPLHLQLFFHDELLAEIRGSLNDRTSVVELTLPTGRDLSWSPSCPRLLDARLSVADDELGSYLGVREIQARPDGLFLNGAPVKLRQVLDQCYWPDTLYAAPDAAALRREAELVASLGFNGMRIHQVTPDPRLLYWADRIGQLVFAEIGAFHEFSALARARLQREWFESVRTNASHPSIICWVPLNESWGLPRLAHNREQQDFAAGLAAETRSLDPTRPALSNDGWEHTDSDLITIHDYTAAARHLACRYLPESLGELLRGTRFVPAHRLLVVGDVQRTAVPVLLDEFGGIRFGGIQFGRGRSRVGSWGYSSAHTRRGFRRAIRALVDAANSTPTLAGWCWTQLTDVRQEANGLCDEQRRPKLPLEQLRAVFGPH